MALPLISDANLATIVPPAPPMSTIPSITARFAPAALPVDAALEDGSL